MDRFVTRKPGNPCSRGPAKPPEKKKRQATIEDLGGVVVVEDILRLKGKLQLENQTSEILVESLQQLGKKIPCKKVMVSSKIGHVVNKLRKHEDPTVAKEAKAVYTKWRTYYQELRDRPQIEVKYDRKGEELRASGRKFLATALRLEVDAGLVEGIEREAVHLCKRRLDKSYRRTMRTLVFTLKHQHKVRADLLAGTLSVEEFVRTNKK